MPTIRDVARLAGCSTATVSRFFNQKPVSRDIERRVVAAIEALAFSPNVVARNLKLKKSMILGMVVPDITNAFFPEVDFREWKLRFEERHEADARHAHAFTFQTWERVRAAAGTAP